MNPFSVKSLSLIHYTCPAIFDWFQGPVGGRFQESLRYSPTFSE